jgi:AcrR family transcriptional regulator
MMADTARQTTGDRRTRRTRQALEQALLELIEEQSYETISVQQITDRANIGRATFYLHYNTKEELLLATVKALTHNFERHLPALSGQELLSGDRRLLIAVFEQVGRYRRLYRALLSGHGPAMVQRRLHDSLSREIERRVVAPLQSAAQKGAQPLVPASFLATYLSGALVAAYTWWLDHDCQESPEDMAILVQHANRPVLLHTLGFYAQPGA